MGGLSVAPTALERFEHQGARGMDIGLDPGEPFGIGLAVLHALALDAVALGEQFVAVQPGEHGVVGERLARHRGQQGDGAPIKAVIAAVRPWSRKAAPTSCARGLRSVMVVSFGDLWGCQPTLQPQKDVWSAAK